MANFKDSKERTWEIPRLDALVIQGIREDCDPEFLKGDTETGRDATFDRLLADPALLCGVVYYLCDKQRKEREIDQKDFYENVIGDAIDDATNALLETVRSFSPRRTRQILDALAKQNQLQEKAIEALNRKLDDPKAIEKVMQGLERRMDAPMS